MDDDRQQGLAECAAQPTLPPAARLPVNRCNLPPVILGSLTFQHHPAPLRIDGVAELHGDLFRQLDRLEQHGQRATYFTDYMVVHFRLHCLHEAGLDARRPGRGKANYRRVVRGWSFDSNGREGAVLKAWVESRFGLTARFHRESLADPGSTAYYRYLADRSAALYGTNALEAQLDLLFTYCQYELARQRPGANHIRLYRGINRADDHEVLGRAGPHAHQVLLNNLNSFTTSRERAEEFGDYIMELQVPLTKVFFHSRLLPDLLKGEEEYVVIGGVYEVTIRYF